MLKINDDFGFLQDVSNWNTHRPMLLLGLHLTEGAVLELGSGHGSTPYLKAYCEAHDRAFQTFDSNREWCDKTGAIYVHSWNAVVGGVVGAHRGLIFIDHAPGERRHTDAITLANAADVLVLHDTEEGGLGNYMWDKTWPYFKYRLNYNRKGGGAGATIVSNKVDVNQFRGMTLGQFTFDND